MELSADSRKLIGISICEGLSFAPIKKIKIEKHEMNESHSQNISQELNDFYRSLELSKHQVQTLIKEKESLLGIDEIQIFEAHLLFLDDPEYISTITEKINNKNLTSAQAVFEATNEFSQILLNLPDPYLSARSHDIQDIGQRILRNLGVDSSINFQSNDSFKGILILKEIFPSFVAELNPQNICGVITEEGSPTSHAAILLRNLEIPSLFGVSGILNQVQNNDTLILDAKSGFILLKPNQKEQQWFFKKQAEYEVEKSLYIKLKGSPAKTRDNFAIQLNSNIGTVSDLKAVENYNSDGIGLFRTEFLFLDRKSPPSEEEQYQIYSKILEAMDGKKTIIRTLDIGGDKEIPYLKLPKEENPFLGLRGLRLCLKHQDLFRIQIRALLRASVHGALSIMYPMVSQVTEWEQAQLIVREEIQALEKSNVSYSSEIRFGIMIEVPAAALMIESFVTQVDFFSLGTNDLIQYTNACDRLNSSVNYLYNHFEPAILKLIHHISQISQKYNKELSLCGEMGGDPQLTAFLIGCGLTNLSMSPQQIPKIKIMLNKLYLDECKFLATEVLKLSSSVEIKKYINEFINHLTPHSHL